MERCLRFSVKSTCSTLSGARRGPGFGVVGIARSRQEELAGLEAQALCGVARSSMNRSLCGGAPARSISNA